MLQPFATLEKRLNAALTRQMSNAQAVIDFGHEVSGIFDRHYATELNYINGTQPVFQFYASSSTWLDELLEDAAITITANTVLTPSEPYTVLFEGTITKLANDGTGWITMYLKEND